MTSMWNQAHRAARLGHKTAALLLGLLLCGAGCTGAGPDQDAAPLPDGGGGDGALPDLRQSDGGSDPVFPRAAGTVLAIEARTPYGQLDEVRATLYDAEQPGFHKEAMRRGDCRLLTYQPALCNTPCNGVCVEPDVCRPFPARLSAGTITIGGLKVAVSLTPQFGNDYYLPTPLKDDLFDAGMAISAEAKGAAFPAFRVTSAGVATLDATAVVNDEIRLLDDADYAFTWAPGGDPQARLRLTLNANNRGHGAPYAAILECDAEDRGSLTISKELIAAFPSTYRWEICAGSDCPFSSALRYRRGVTTAGTRTVELIAGSRRSFWVLHRPPR